MLRPQSEIESATPGRPPESVGDAAADLFLGSSCCGCQTPGRLLCESCAGALVAATGPMPVRPSPCPPGLGACWSGLTYDSTTRQLIVGHKEHRLFALAGPLGQALGTVIGAAVEGTLGRQQAPLVLVPVPSRPASVRARGYDATAALARTAARWLHQRGYDVIVAPVLRVRGPVADQAGLDAQARLQNMSGGFWCPARGVGWLARRTHVGHVVVCDDVLTTGATALEAQRALRAVGLPEALTATIAATARHSGRVGPLNLAL